MLNVSNSFLIVPAVVTMVLTSAAGAQPEMDFFRTFNGGYLTTFGDHIQTTDGGFLLIGATRAEPFDGTRFLWLLKTDSHGDSLWSATYDIPREGVETYDNAAEIIETADGGYLIFGSHQWNDERFGRHGNVFVLCVDSDGDSLWTKEYGGEWEDRVNSVVQLQDGGYALAGFTDSWGNGDHDYYLLRLDENCDSLWMQTYGGRGVDECNSIIQTGDGGFALAGNSNLIRNLDNSFWVVFTDSQGDSLWSYGAAFEEWTDNFCYTITEFPGEDGDPSYMLAGLVEWDNQAKYDAWAIAINEQGERLWDRRVGIDSIRVSEHFSASAITDSGNIVLSGYFKDRIGLVEISPVGELIYERYWDLAEWENIEKLYCYSMFLTDENALSLAGHCGKDTLLHVRVFWPDYFLLNMLPEPTSVGDAGFPIPNFPNSVFLGPGFPNPFNDHVTLSYSLPAGQNGEIQIFNSTSRLVSRLIVDPSDGRLATFTWNANELPSGKYIVQLHSGRIIGQQTLTLLR